MKEIITRLLHLISEVPQQLQAFSVDEMTKRPAPGKWSKREILGHLCDSAMHNWQRFNLAQQTDEPLQIVAFKQDELVLQNNWQGQTTSQVVTLWASLNTQVVAVLKNIPSEKLLHTVIFPNGKELTLEYLVANYLAHLEHHLRQIFTKKTNPPTLPEHWKISSDEALDMLKNHPDGKPFITLLERERMYVEVYQPQKIDLRKPHNLDEIYVIISGSGQFLNNGERRPFSTGDLIYVPAGIEHRFEDFTDDFATWVIFY